MSKKNTTTKTTGVYKDKVLAGMIQERIVALLSKKGGEWSGSVSELMLALKRVGGKSISNFPTSPSVMRRVVNNVVYSLRRSKGVSVKFARTTDHMRKRVVEFVQR